VSPRGPHCDRRGLLALGGIAAGCLALPGAAAVAARPPAVLTFFGDRPMIDPSGSLAGWHAPNGFRGGAGVAGLDTERLIRAGLQL